MGTYPSALAQMQQVADTTFCPDDDRDVMKIAMLMSPSSDRFNVSCPRARACEMYSCVWPLRNKVRGAHNTLQSSHAALPSATQRNRISNKKKRGINDRTPAAKRQHYGCESGRASATEQRSAVASQLATRKVSWAGAAAPYQP